MGKVVDEDGRLDLWGKTEEEEDPVMGEEG